MPRPKISPNGIAVRRNIVFTPELSDRLEEYKRSTGVGYSEAVRESLERYLFVKSNPDSRIEQEKKEIERLDKEEDEVRKRLEGIQQSKQRLSLQSSEREKLIAFEKRQNEEEEAQKKELEELNKELAIFPPEKVRSTQIGLATTFSHHMTEADKVKKVLEALRKEEAAQRLGNEAEMAKSM